MADKLPAFQFYPGDWRKDPGVQAMKYEERGVWWETLCIMHESEERGRLTLGGKPIKTARLAQLLKLSEKKTEKFFKIFTELGVCSVDENGAFFNRRMVKEEDIRKAKSRAGKAGMASRWDSGGSGCYNKSDNKPDNRPNNKPITQGITKRGSSSSSSSSKKKKKESKPKKEKEKTHFAEFVTLTQAEHDKLCSDHGSAVTNACIQKLDNYKGASGKTYKSDYRAILSWVLDDVKNRASNPPGNGMDRLKEMAMGVSDGPDGSGETAVRGPLGLPTPAGEGGQVG